MRYFGRSKEIQMENYQAELLAIEKEVFMDNYKEMVALLEAAEEADPYSEMSRHSPLKDDPRSIRKVQKDIKAFTKKLDEQTRARITKRFLELAEGGAR